MGKQVVWRVVDDPAYTMRLMSLALMTLFMIGLVIISVIDPLKAIIAMAPPLALSGFMALYARRYKSRVIVELTESDLRIVRDGEKYEVPLMRVDKIIAKPVVFKVRVLRMKYHPLKNLRLNTWSLSFIVNGVEAAKVWVGEKEFEKLIRVLRGLGGPPIEIPRPYSLYFSPEAI